MGNDVNSWCQLCVNCVDPCNTKKMFNPLFKYDGYNPSPKCFVSQKSIDGLITPSKFIPAKHYTRDAARANMVYSSKSEYRNDSQIECYESI